MSIATVEAVLDQVEQLSLEEKLLLLEKIAHAVRTEQKTESPPKKRIMGLHQGMGWMADDFDALDYYN